MQPHFVMQQQQKKKTWLIGTKFLIAHPEQEGEFRVPVADVAVLAIGHIYQSHYHLSKAHEGAVDTAGFLKEKQWSRKQAGNRGNLHCSCSVCDTVSYVDGPWVWNLPCACLSASRILPNLPGLAETFWCSRLHWRSLWIPKSYWTLRGTWKTHGSWRWRQLVGYASP